MISTRVLLVEDDAFLREIYTDTLSKEGFSVASATDGNEALATIKEGNWDLLLLDIILPHMDGIEVLKQLQTDEAFSHLLKKPIIFLTNLDNDEEKQQALTLGKGYLVKSQINPGELVTKINEILEPQA